jgi:hypothetical protein
VERQPWRSSKLGLPQPSVLDIPHDGQWHPYHFSRSAHLLQTVVLYEHILWMATTSTRCRWPPWAGDSYFTCEGVLNVHSSNVGHGLTPILSPNVGIKSTSGSVFVLISSGTSLWASVSNLTRWLLKDIVMFWNCSTGGAWGTRCGYSTSEIQHTVGKWLAVVLRDTSRKVGWAWGTDCMANSVAGWNFSCGDSWSYNFTQFLTGISKISWQDFKQQWQRSMPAC